MKSLLMIASFLFFSTAYGRTLSVAQQKDNFEESPEFKAILEEIKKFGGFAAKVIEEKTIDESKTMSRGQQMVEEAKARNRAILKENAVQDKKDSDSELSYWDKIKKEDQKTRDSWKKQSRDTLAAWKKEQDIFLGRIKEYKEAAFVLPVTTKKIVEKKITLSEVPDMAVVNGAFAVPVRDQRSRATCAAFAGIRAIEIILEQNGLKRDLSEQYLYWASKPKCQSSPCAEKGSWVRSGYIFSRDQKNIDIPAEESCAYKTISTPANETQVPLEQSCFQGTTKVETFEEVETLADVVARIKADTPVIISTKLTENFYLNKGLIKLSDVPAISSKMDAHALGHAYLAVGIVELPEKLRVSEGDFCIIVTNSWGKGWGAGGFSCVTQNWLMKYRTSSTFMAVTKVSVKE